MASLPTLDPVQLQAEVTRLNDEVRWLNLKVKDLEARLFGHSSEKTLRLEGQMEQTTPMADLLKEAQNPPVPVPTPAARKAPAAGGAPKGPKPLDPSLEREIVRLPDPDLKDLICPVSGKLMKPGFVEAVEVLARRPAVFYVKRLERNVYVSPAKSAPVCSPWPEDVMPRARMHASVIGHIACAHFCDHMPYHRIEAQLSRAGVELARSTQVSLMAWLDARMEPLVKRLKDEVFASGYIHLDATPVDLLDPDRPGAARESALWVYRSREGPLWFDFRMNKSPRHPRELLKGYKGILQADGAPGFEGMGEGIILLGCWSHARRYFFKAVEAGEKGAAPYLKTINGLFRIDRLAKHFKLEPDKCDRLRQRHSVPIAEELFAGALKDIAEEPPKTRLGEALGYLLGQKGPLMRAVSTAGARLDNNPAENAIRPLKIGAKNWLFIGHPDAGPRLANLFTLVENCRQCDADPEAYLIDMIARLQEHPASKIAELLPAAWLKDRAKAQADAKPPVP